MELNERGTRAATATDLEGETAPGQPIDPLRLYRLWEENNWSAYALDFSQDAVNWREQLTPVQRRAAHWNYALFLHGEEAVARTLAPFVAAVRTQEQRVFLTTQIVDEARHHIFFSRFMREVVGDGHDLSSTLHAMRLDLTTGYLRVFGELDRLTDRLRRHPGNRPLLAQCFCLYHILVEGMLAHPAQHFMLEHLSTSGLLPGFTTGVAHVARDESRHMAFGIQCLKELVAESPAARRAVIALLNRVLPWTVTVFVPPGFDEEYLRCFGIALEDVFAFGLRSLATKLERVGIAPTDVAELVKLGATDPAPQQVERLLLLLRAGVLGDAVPLHVTDDVQHTLFEGVARVANMQPAALPGPVQWHFADGEPWYLAVRAGRFVTQPGRAEQPALTLHCTVADWARIAGKKLSPQRAMLTRRLRLTGDLRLALRLPTLLAA